MRSSWVEKGPTVWVEKGPTVDWDKFQCNISMRDTRALALENVNVKCKKNLVFTSSKTLASENCKQQYYKFYYNTATVQF